MPELSKKERKALLRLFAAALLLIVAALLPTAGWLRLVTFVLPYLIVGGEVLLRAGRNLAHGQVFDENFLMSLATLGAFALGEYPEAVFVMLFYQVGELFEHIAVGRSRRSIAALMDIRPDTAHLEEADGALRDVDPEEVEAGSVILVRPGERVPLDGLVLEGSSSLDTAALTGESLPRDVGPGETVVSGCVNLTGLLRVQTTRVYGESTVARILELVENSSLNKAKSEDFITRFARWYTPAVVAGAALVAVVPPLFDGQWAHWIHQALLGLVISCPCALVLSVPLSYFGGIGGASRCGILVKGSNYLEALAAAETVVFDKTGTLTQGSFSVTALRPAGCGEAELLELAALAESASTHPIAASIRRAYGQEPERSRVTEIREEAGHGVAALVDGKPVLAGNARLLRAHGIAAPEVGDLGTVVHLARDGVYLGSLTVSDAEKPEAREALASLRAHGVKTLMLTGDRREVAEAVAQDLGIDQVRAELLPLDKVTAVEEAIRARSPRGKVVFVGDGINDAPVLARADLGVAMGVMGSDAAIEAADIVLMDDDLRKLEKAIALSRRTNRIVWENILFALAVKLLVLLLGVLGLATMWSAIFADVGVLVLAVLNAMRTLRVASI